MKKIAMILLMLAKCALSMEDDGQRLDESEVALPSPRGLPNFVTYSFIDALKPNEVLLSQTTESGLNATNVFNDFLVVCHQRVRYEDAFYFVPTKMIEDAKKALSLYFTSDRGFYAYLIAVDDAGKFLQLASKTSAGCANKDGSWVNDVEWKELDRIFSEGLDMLDYDQIAYAMDAPSQGSDPVNGHWSCGPNSGFRALRLLGETDYDYGSFVEHCPKTSSKEKTAWERANSVAMLPLVSLTGNFSLIHKVIGDIIPSDVGPTPTMLAEFLTRHMRNHSAHFCGYSSRSHYEMMIIDRIYWRGPTIVLIVSGTFSMHYVNIIGVRSTSDYRLSEAVILDTDGAVGIISGSKLHHWLDSHGYANVILDARYNTLRFNNPRDILLSLCSVM